MGQRCHILNRRDAQSRSLQRRYGWLTPGPRTLYPDLDFTYTIAFGRTCATLCSLLRGKRRTLSRSLKADTPGRTRTYSITVFVGDSNQRIVESGLYMDNGPDNIPSDFSF